MWTPTPLHSFFARFKCLVLNVNITEIKTVSVNVLSPSIVKHAPMCICVCVCVCVCVCHTTDKQENTIITDDASLGKCFITEWLRTFKGATHLRNVETVNKAHHQASGFTVIQ